MASKKRDPPPSSDTTITAMPEADAEMRTDATLLRASLQPSETMVTDLPAAPARAQDTMIGAPPSSRHPQTVLSSALSLPDQVDTDGQRPAAPREREFATVADESASAYIPLDKQPADVGTLPGIPALESTHIQPAIQPPPARGRSQRQRVAPQPEPLSQETTLPPTPSIHDPARAANDTGFMRALARRRGLRERPRGMPAWAPEWSIPFFELPRQTQLIAGGGSVGVAVILLLILVTTVTPGERKHRGLTTNPQIGRMYAEAKESVLEHRYDEAVAALEAIKQITPDNEEALDYLAFAKKERDAKAVLDRATRELEGHRFDEARTAAKQVPDDSESSTSAKALLHQIDSEQARSLLEVAEGQIKAGQLDQAKAAVAAVSQLDATLGQQLAKELAGAPIPARPSSGGHRNTAAHEEAAVATELAPAFQAFNDDPLHAADQFEQLGKASRTPAVQKRAVVLGAAARACGRARASALGSGEAALLQNAYDRCAEVVAEGPLAMDLHAKVIAAYNRQAEDGRSSNNLGQAARAYRGMLAMQPGDIHARRELDGLIAEAHGIYMNAYVLCDTDPDEAAKRLREVVGILAPGDADYAKAKDRLDRLRPP